MAEFEEQAELDQPQIMNVKVVNRNDFSISDRFDSVPYIFEPNRPQSVPIDAANHIFGWFPGADPAAVKKHVQKRFGWNTPDMQKDGRSDSFYSKLEIKPILYRMVAVETDEEGNELPADPVKRSPKVNKLMSAADEREARA